MSRPLASGVGLGHRPEVASDLLASPTVVDFVEVVAESALSRDEARKEARAISRMWPVVAHGVKLSLGSADGVDDERAKRLGALAREVNAPVVSEHVSFTRGGSWEIGHLTQLPRTREAIRVVARNVERARRFLPDVPLWLENVAFSFRWPDDEMAEADFYQEIVAATGCELLLDVGNLYANAVNEGLDPASVLEAYPLDRVGMLHVAGGVLECGFYFDTHAHPIPDAVFALVGRVLELSPDLPILLERDGGFGPFAELASELAKLRELRARAVKHETGDAARESPRTRACVALPVERQVDSSAGELGALQVDVARLLVATEAPSGALADRFGRIELSRARAILTRKRVDDALPLLGHLALHDGVRAIAERVTASTPRAPRGAGPADAIGIAAAATEEPSLRDAARADALLLRARFSGPDASGRVRPRVLPFFGAATLDDGTRLRVRKGFGAFAPVRTS